jgi:hypothetical protein
MNIHKSILLSALLSGLAAPALADNDAITCSSADQATWMTKDAAKEATLKMGYKEVRKVKVSGGNCFEIYVISAEGKKMELYMDPVTGQIVGQD